MKITQDVREYAEENGMEEMTALQTGIQEKAHEFKRRGGEIYE